MNKRRVLLLFGGRSGEHEVSIVSATHVLHALDRDRYEVELVGITKQGEWVSLPPELPPTELDNPQRQFPPRLLPPRGQSMAVPHGVDRSVDVVLPILHGPFGEDGTIQGLLELSGVPYVGCGVLASSVAMDKVTAKRLFRDAGIPVTEWEVVRRRELIGDVGSVLDRIERRFPFPVFVKPVNLGSSVGVSKAGDRRTLTEALAHAGQFDRRVMVEPAVPAARELELAVLGNDEPRVSVPGEIVPDREFYDYDSKYGTESTSRAVIPAKLADPIMRILQRFAREAFLAIEGSGMARVDFLMNGETNELFLNEVNTIPGFTPISMYPKLWEASGLSYGQLLDELIRLALERAAEKQSLRTSRV